MDIEKIKQRILGMIPQRGRKVDNKSLTFAAFLGISAFLWFFNALSKTYIAELEAPVQFVGVPRDMLPHGELPRTLTIQVSGRGFALLRHKVLPAASAFKFDLQHLFVDYQENVGDITIHVSTQQAKKQAEQYYGGVFVVSDIYPRNLNATFSRIEFRKVPVRHRGGLGFEAQFWQRGATRIEPDSVELGGPKSVVDTTTEIFTKPVRIHDINKLTTVEAELDSRGVFELSQRRVQVTVDAERYTEVTVDVPIRVINLPESQKIMLFPDFVTAKTHVSLDDYEKVTADKFSAIVDFNSLNVNVRGERARVDVLEFPDNVRLVSTQPKTVSYIVSVAAP